MVQGLETATFPGNVGWYLPGDQYDPACPKKLSDLSIHEICKHLTNARIGNARPSCEYNWEDKLDAVIPWDLVWPSIGTALTTPEEEAVWFRFLHRGMFVHNRDAKGDNIMCRLKCGFEESQLHLLRCPATRPFWSGCLAFLRDAGYAQIPNFEAAAIFGLQSPTKLMDEGARAFLRHAMREFWNAFSAVDLRNAQWQTTRIYLATLEALRRSLVRRAAAISIFHAGRAFTDEADGIPAEDARLFPELIEMSPTGEYSIAPVLTRAIAKTSELIERERQQKQARAQKRKRPAKAPDTRKVAR